MPSSTLVSYVGLDISREQLDYALSETELGMVPNTAEGRAKLIEPLRKLGQVRIVCEATGGYERPVVTAFLEAGLSVCVVQPGRARAFAQAEGLLAKTDRIDAKSLRRYGMSIELRPALA